MVLVYATVFVCAAILVALVRRYDLHGREPWYMVVMAVALGAGMMALVGQMENYVLRRLQLDLEEYAAKAAFIAAAEESAKLLVVAAIAVMFRRRFPDVFAGLIYGTFVGLGMGLNESLLYLSLAAAPAAPVLGAEIVRLFGHSLMGGVIGFALGLFVFPVRPTADPASRPRRRPILAFSSALVAGLVHFGWDFLAYQPHHGMRLRGVLMLLMLSLVLLWGSMVAFALERSHRRAGAPGFRRANVTPGPTVRRREATIRPA
jgi:RsiW-degrading membrane proteinase PrsW (M82 family)